MAGLLRSVSAIRIFTHNLERARQFYAGMLELDEQSAEPDYVTFDLAGVDIVIERVAPDDPEATRLVGRFLAASFSVDNIVEVCRELAERGVSLLQPPEKQEWGGTLAFLCDPDDNVITLVEYPPVVAPSSVRY